MKKQLILYILLVVSFNLLIAQKEASHWYFGENAGLDFNSGSPVADTSGALNTIEGCATISDANGNLLFYTDGTTVWNRNHAVMPTGSGLFGNSSSSQSAIIVPKPLEPTTYFIFTVDWSGGTRGLNFYTVDMSLDGGLGDVVGVNNVPTPTNLLTAQSTEKITAIKVLDEDAFWVISLKQGQFFVYKVDSNGVNTTPVAGNSGFSGIGDVRGYLKTSPDGKKLVSANMSMGTFLYDFDDATGIITNERVIDVSNRFAYGVEFSPLSRKLYISTGNFENEVEKLYQFTVDMAMPTSANINASRVEIHSYFNSRSALQIGLDGKIYRAIEGTSSLGVINNPEGDGLACNYQHEAISLGGRISKQGLPPFIQSFFIAAILAENLCFGDSTSFSVISNEPILSIRWDFGDGITSTVLNPTHVYSAPGDYLITVEVTTADETKTVTQTITILEVPTIVSPVTLQQCDDDTDGITSFNLREVEGLITSDTPVTISYHETLADAEANTGLISNLTNFSNATASQVFVRIENQLSCFSIAQVNLEVSTTDIPDNFMIEFRECDTTILDNDDTNGITHFDFSSATNTIRNLFPANQNLIVTYYESIVDALAEQNAVDATNFRNENFPFNQQLVVRVDSQDNNACLGMGFHISLIVDPLPEFEVADPQYLCTNLLPDVSIIGVENPEDNYTYEWRDAGGNLLSASSTTPTLAVNALGDYFVTATTAHGCSRTKKVTVVASNAATIANIEVVDDSDNNTITVNVTGDGDYEYALDNIDGPYQDSNLFEHVFAGIRTVYIRDKRGCGLISEEVAVIGFPRFFTPNGDGVNDTWQVLGIRFQLASKIYIYDRFGKIIKKIAPNSEGWDGTYRGKQMPATDYWFTVKLEDGRFRRGHFSLIKR